MDNYRVHDAVCPGRWATDTQHAYSRHSSSPVNIVHLSIVGADYTVAVHTVI